MKMSESTEKSLIGLAKGGSIAGMLALALWIMWGAFSDQNKEMKQYFNARIDNLEKRLDECQDEEDSKLHYAIEKIYEYVKDKSK
jgi:hypothetical protein